jgi:hypothetical protein
MKALILPLLFFVLASSLFAQKTNDIEVAVAARDKGVASSQAQHRDRVFQFKKTYTNELARQEYLTRAKGDLEGLLAIRSESERMDRPLTPDELKALPEAARASRDKFDQSVARSLAQERAEVAAHDRAYAATLKAIQARLTRAGDIEGALKAKSLLDAPNEGKGSAAPVTAGVKPVVPSADRAAIEPNGGRIAVLAEGGKMFSDRNHEWSPTRIPPFVRGWNYIVASIHGSEATCTKPGTIYMLTHAREPDTWGDSIEKSSTSQGFVRVATIKYGDNEGNVYSVLTKRVKTGERIKWGRFGVLIF